MMRGLPGIISAAVVLSLVVILPVTGDAFSFGRFEKAPVVGGEVRVPLAKVSDGTARFYRLRDGGKEIAFFVVADSRKVIRVAFDACDACWREKKGYRQEGGVMRCQNCGQKFAIDRLGPHAVGGCNPASLPHQVRGDQVVIRLDDIRSGARYF